MSRRNQKITIAELRVGIFMLVAIIVTGFLIINSSGSFNPFEQKLRLKARFVSADGLSSGADVQLAGVSIGRVEEVKFLPPDFEEDDRIEATFVLVSELDRRPMTELIRSDSKALLVATSVLGNDKMINITPGTTKGTPVTENSILASSSGISFGQLATTGNDLIDQINKLAIPANDILNKANQGEGTLGRVINDETLYLSLDGAVNETKATMTRLQTTIDRINRGEGSAGKLVNDPELYDSLNRTVAQLEAISNDLRAGRGTAGKLFTDEELYNDTRAAIAELRSAAGTISEIAGDVRGGRGSVGKLFQDEQLYEDARSAINRFNSTIARVELLVADAQAGKGTIGRLVTDETLYNSVNVTANNIATFTGEGTKLLDDFRKNPKKYLRIKLALF